MNIIHGDINSQNVMVNADCDAKLIDFDNAGYVGKKMIAAGNFDFCNEEMRKAILKGKKLTVCKD
jgi:serine/threonine protein kinase